MDFISTRDLAMSALFIALSALVLAFMGWHRQSFWLGYMHKKFENLWSFVTTGKIKIE